MSSLMDMHLDKVKDPIVVPAGEYELKITSAKIEPSKSSDRDLIKIAYKILDQPEAQAVFDNMCFPIKGDTEDTVYFFQLQIKKFCQAFGLDLTNPGEPPEWKGLTAWNNLKQEPNDQTGDIQNTIGTWVVKK